MAANGITVMVHTPMPTALHRQLRLRAMGQDMAMKDATIAAVEAWVAPGEREAQIVRQVLAILDQSLSKPETKARIEALLPSR